MRPAKVLLLLAAIASVVMPRVHLGSGPSLPDPYSEESFRRWLAMEQGRQARFDRFETFLMERKVAEIVPAWQLLRTDANYAARCGIEAFQIPPEAKWPAIVPTLRVLKEDVIPVVGRVEVFASYRDDALNDCANGAKRSRHLGFEAVDLIAPDRHDNRELFADLCRLHQRVGRAREMGLGAYFDPSRPTTNTQGRFHIDTAGFRTWGFGYTGRSSACLATS